MVPKRPNIVSAKLQQWAIGRRVWAFIRTVFGGIVAYVRFFFRLIQSPFQKMPLPILCVIMLILGATVAGTVASVVLDRRRNANETVVTVSGQPITSPQFYRKLETRTGRDVMAKLSADAFALAFADSLGAMPTSVEIESQVKIRLKTPGWTQFAAEHHVTTDDLRYMFRLQIAREKAVRACNAGAAMSNGGGQSSTDMTQGNSTQPNGARYVEQLARFRKNAKVNVKATEYANDIVGRVQ